MCADINSQYTTNPSTSPCGCSPSFYQTVIQIYNCTATNPDCNSYICTETISQEVLNQLGQCQLP